uniref:Ig-like domain-containing protein n=1 Tax=Poecilia reticulata TaxID=8081 RepID=A0A3P9NIN0_POERE
PSQLIDLHIQSLMLLFQQAVTCFTSSLSVIYYYTASGQNINISCEVSDEKSIITVEWRRAEDPEDDHVIVYKNEKISSDDQLKQFKGRVNLTIQERSLSLIVKNVTTNDSGTFECRVQRAGSGGMEHVCTRSLEVSPPAGESVQQLPGSDPDQMGMIFSRIRLTPGFWKDTDSVLKHFYVVTYFRSGQLVVLFSDVFFLHCFHFILLNLKQAEASRSPSCCCWTGNMKLLLLETRSDQ